MTIPAIGAVTKAAKLVAKEIETGATKPVTQTIRKISADSVTIAKNAFGEHHTDEFYKGIKEGLEGTKQNALNLYPNIKPADVSLTVSANKKPGLFDFTISHAKTQTPVVIEAVPPANFYNAGFLRNKGLKPLLGEPTIKFQTVG